MSKGFSSSNLLNLGKENSLTDYILVGCGGFALEVAEYIKNEDYRLSLVNERAIVSDVVSESSSRFDDICSVLEYFPIIHESTNTIVSPSDKKVLVCLGSPEDRHRNYTSLKKLGFSFGTLIHGTAWVSESARVCEGSIVAPFAFIGAKAEVGANCVVNVRATVGHDVYLGESSVLSPHSDMNGASRCGRVSLIGAGAFLDPEAAIGDYTKVASGSVIKQQFGDGYLLAGNPAKGRQMYKIGNTDTE